MDGSSPNGTDDTAFAEETLPRVNENNMVVVDEENQENDRLYPKAFYCPKIHQLMHDPVVASDGISYERSAVLANCDDGSVLLYSNRALKGIIDATLKTQNNNPDFALSLWSSTSAPNSIGGSKNTSAPPPSSSSSNDDNKNLITTTTSNTSSSFSLTTTTQFQLPEVLFCPITFNLIHIPAIDPEGNTYERVAIENWIDTHHNSPITRTPLDKTQLRPNLTLQKLLEEESSSKSNTNTIFANHPQIIKWKNETPPTTFEITTTRGEEICLVNDRDYTSPNHEQEAARTRRNVAWVILFCIVAVSPYWLRNLWGGGPMDG